MPKGGVVRGTMLYIADDGTMIRDENAVIHGATRADGATASGTPLALPVIPGGGAVQSVSVDLSGTITIPVGFQNAGSSITFREPACATIQGAQLGAAPEITSITIIYDSTDPFQPIKTVTLTDFPTLYRLPSDYDRDFFYRLSGGASGTPTPSVDVSPESTNDDPGFFGRVHVFTASNGVDPDDTLTITIAR